MTSQSPASSESQARFPPTCVRKNDENISAKVRTHLFHHFRGSLLVFQLSRQFLVDFRLLCGLNTTAINDLASESDWIQRKLIKKRSWYRVLFASSFKKSSKYEVFPPNAIMKKDKMQYLQWTFSAQLNALNKFSYHLTMTQWQFLKRPVWRKISTWNKLSLNISWKEHLGMTTDQCLIIWSSSPYLKWDQHNALLSMLKSTTAWKEYAPVAWQLLEINLTLSLFQSFTPCCLLFVKFIMQAL